MDLKRVKPSVGQPFPGKDCFFPQGEQCRGGVHGRTPCPIDKLAADLGNVRSRLIRQLVAFVRRRNDGYERFQRMGLVRRPPRRDRSRNVKAAALVNCLRPWTAKQVRTHFNQLRCTGMITAERETANGPWRYALPEELQGRRGAYRHLPTAAEPIARHPPG